MKYELNIYPIVSSDNSLAIYNNATTDSRWEMVAFECDYSITTTDTSAQFVLNYVNSLGYNTADNNNTNSILSSDIIREGQPIILTEKYNNGVLSRVVFVGYIGLIQISVDLASGTQFVFQCPSILAQLNRSSLVVTTENNTQFGTPLSIGNNFINFISLLQACKRDSVMDMFSEGGALGDSIFSQESLLGDTTAFPFVIRDLGQTSLPETVPVYSAVQETKISALSTLLYPYNRIVYQDAGGATAIQPLFIDDTESIYDINIEDQNAPDILLRDSQAKYLNFRVVKNSATVRNFMAYAFTPSLTYGVSSDTSSGSAPFIATADPTYFSRVSELYKTGLFTQVELGSLGLSPDFMNINTLQNFINALPKTDNLANQNISQIPRLFGQRAFAEEMMKAELIEVDFVRETCSAAQIPLTKVITVNSYNNPMIGFNKKYVCYGAKLSHNLQQGTILSLQLCPIGSIVALWETIAS